MGEENADCEILMGDSGRWEMRVDEDGTGGNLC